MSLAPRCIAAITVAPGTLNPGKRGVDVAVAQTAHDLGVRDALRVNLTARDTQVLKHALRDMRGRAAGRAQRDAKSFEVVERLHSRRLRPTSRCIVFSPVTAMPRSCSNGSVDFLQLPA